MRGVPLVAILLLILLRPGLSAQNDAAGGRTSALSQPRNIILFIGDGMGPEQIDAASLYASGGTGGLSFSGFPVRNHVATDNVRSRVTDSAAAATALATGEKVANGALSVMRPGSRDELPTIFEIARDAGLSTGIVTTTSVTHATVAAFAAHEPRRHWYRRIARDYLEQTRPNVIFGGVGMGVSLDAFREAGYEVVEDREGLRALAETPISAESMTGHYAVLLGDGHLPYIADGRPEHMPDLVELTEAAVRILRGDPDGFLLVVEAGRIDHAGHANDISRLVPELLELDRTVRHVLALDDIAQTTLILVTADHETGGLEVVENQGPGELPVVTWSTPGHTGVDVPLFATGPGSDVFATIRDNTEIFFRMRDALGL